MNIINKYIIPNGFVAITIFPFVFYKDKKYITVHRNIHEKIHLRQQVEMLIIPFFTWYLIEYLIRLIQYRNSRIAYRNISFEKESYNNETDLGYLKRRELYSWIKYL